MGSDRIAWKPLYNGDFTISSAYDIVRNRRASQLSGKMIWNLLIPIKVAVFIWRLLNSALPFPDVLKELGFHLPSKCPFCDHEDELNHFFSKCSFAETVWKHFTGLLPIPPSLSLDLFGKLQIWWS